MKIFIKVLIILSLVALGLMGTVSTAFAAGPPEKVDGFVCPVLGGQAGLHGIHNGVTPIAGGYYTHGGPNVTVPVQTTNEGWPGTAGSFLVPGEVGYGAIWNFANAPD